MTVLKENQTEIINLRIAGICYIVATASAMAGLSFFISAMAGDNVGAIYSNRSHLVAGTLLQLINDAAVVIIGVLFYRVLNSYHKTIALWILVTRLIEAVILITGKMGLLTLIPLGKSFVENSQPEAVFYDTLRSIAVNWHQSSFSIAMISLGLGGWILSYFLYTRRVVPLIFPVTGFIAYGILLGNSVLNLWGHETGNLAFLGAALFELIFPLWIIFKGFSKTDNQKIHSTGHV